MIPVGRIALTYFGIALAFAAARRASPGALRAAMRGAWLAGFSAVAIPVLIDSILGHRAEVDILAAVGPVAWVVVTRCGGPWTVLGVAGIAALAIEAGLRQSAAASVVVAIAGLVGVWLASAMVARAQLVLRAVAYWLSFVGTFGLILPVALAERTGGAGAPAIGLAATLAVSGGALGLAATRAFLSAGGTPEPLDPPSRLVTEGLYAQLRHPIQLAEVALVFAGAALFPQRWVALYAISFALALTGPLRRREERRLEARFGEAYRLWEATVPAYVPRGATGPTLRLPQRSALTRAASPQTTRRRERSTRRSPP